MTLTLSKWVQTLCNDDRTANNARQACQMRRKKESQSISVLVATLWLNATSPSNIHQESEREKQRTISHLVLFPETYQA